VVHPYADKMTHQPAHAGRSPRIDVARLGKRGMVPSSKGKGR